MCLLQDPSHPPPPGTVRWRSASLSAAVEEGTKAVAGTRLGRFCGVETPKGEQPGFLQGQPVFFNGGFNQLDDDSKSLHQKWLEITKHPLKQMVV